ncbi:MAG: hypothetical protein AAGD96_14470 [Chloroflexota bacterium]
MSKRNVDRITADAPEGLKKLVNQIAGKYDLKISDLVSYLVMKGLLDFKTDEIEERLIPIKSMKARFGMELSDLINELGLDGNVNRAPGGRIDADPES